MVQPPRQPIARRGLLRRLDAAARDLNTVLIVISIGLAVLDVTVAVTHRALERLPITRVVCDDSGASRPPSLPSLSPSSSR